MSTHSESAPRAESVALAQAARLAGFAPSIHNTQPWRWRVDGPRLDLRAQRDRQLRVTDPDGRLLAISCGTALHHVRVALAAEGWQVDVVRMPDPADPDLLARLTVTGRTDVLPEAMRLLQTMRIRHTDRRPVAGTPPGPDALNAIREAVEGEGARLHVLRPDDVIELAAAADHAQRVEAMDPAWRDELAYWAGGSRADGLGVPDEAIPVQPPATTVPGRDFGRGGSLPVSAGHDRAARYGILYGDDDSLVNWLRGGEALSASWLIATEQDLTLLPLSATVEVTETRQKLRQLISNVGEPYLVLRFGTADPDHAGPPHTPRLPAEQVVEIAG
ncbi:MAG TPA: nitroreductase [Micromonosporaceae bacterium]